MVTGWPRVGDDLAGGGLHGGVGAGRLGRDAAVDLRARVGVLVEGGAAGVGRDRVRARGHGLGLERLGRPRRRALARDHAADVVLEVERVDGDQAASPTALIEQRAAVAAVAHAGHRGAVQAQRLADGGVDAQGPGDRAHALAGRVAQLEAGGAAAHACRSWPGRASGRPASRPPANEIDFLRALQQDA